MTWRLLLILIHLIWLAASTASANNLCQNLFNSQNDKSIQLWGAVFNPSQHGYETTNTLINTRWSSSGHSESQLSGTNLIVRMNEYPDDYMGFVPTPDQINATHRAQSYFHGLQLFTESFTRRSAQDEINNIIASDQRNFWKFLTDGRMGYAAVSSKKAYAGFMRVLDCTDYGRVLAGKGASVFESYLSPTEVVARKNQHQILFFEEMRDLGYHIFQVGKYAIDRGLSASDRETTRSLLLTWLKTNYLDASRYGTEKVIFVFNVDSLVHKNLYAREFGATEVDRDKFIPAWPQNESLLYVDLPTLLKKLEYLDVNQSGK